MKNERNNNIVFVVLLAPVFCFMLMGIASSSLGEIVIYETDFDPGLPGDWVIENKFTSSTWTSEDIGGWNPDNLTPPYMIVDSASAGDADMDERLISPSIDCSSYTKVILKFKNNFRFWDNEIGYVDVWIEGGLWQYTTQWFYQENSDDDVVEDISSFAAGQEDVQISWHYYNAYNDLYWAIDDVQVVGLLPRIVYVDQDAPGSNDGGSWANAYIDLQDALGSAVDGDTIRVAQGEHKPDRGTEDRTASFNLINQVAIIGGYAGYGELDPNHRDILRYPTILTGDLLGNDNPDFTGMEDNSHHVVRGHLVDGTAILDGFVIKGGNAYPEYGAGLLNWGASPTITNCVFTRNYAGSGAGICNLFSSSPTITECTFHENKANEYGAGLFNFSHSSPALDYCLLQANQAGIDGGGIYSYGGNTRLSNCTLIENSATGNGGGINQNRSMVICNDCIVSNNQATEGGEIYNTSDSAIYFTNAITKDPNFIHEVYIGGTMVFQQDTKVSSGNFEIKELGTLLFEDDTWLTLEDRGKIISHGTLWARGSARIENTHIEVTRMHFYDQAIIFNNVINAEAGSPYGQFYIEEFVTVEGNQIHADGDRYLDLDPSVFDGLVENNVIYVTITEGVGNTQGGLLELRGQDGLVNHVCDPNMFLCRVDTEAIPDCNQVSWTIEELHLIEGAKLNLTNRFDFHEPYDSGGEYEVLYVRKIILEKDAVLNTAFNRVYYEILEDDPNSRITHQPLLGFSLHNITFDHSIDYLTRVTHNNFIHPEDPNLTRIHVERIVSQPPDPPGMMKMTNLIDLDPNSIRYEDLINARAKALFAKSSEQEILIQFEYLFCSEQGELVIYLTDVPELLSHADPDRSDHYLEVARLYPPPADRPGGPGSQCFGVFRNIFNKEHLNFIRGTRIAFELIGPEGTCIWIDNWDPSINCSLDCSGNDCIYCGDLTGDLGVTVSDYLSLVGEYGRQPSNNNDYGQSMGCLEGKIFTDGYINTYDTLFWDWLENIKEDVGNFCFEIPLVHDSVGGSQKFPFEYAIFETDQDQIHCEPNSHILIAGKYYNLSTQDYLGDRLYCFDDKGQITGPPQRREKDRLNYRLVRDFAGKIYQLNIMEGLFCLSDDDLVIAPGTRIYRKRDPRYDEPGATIQIGLHGSGESWWGRPILDAAFDSQGFVYIVPVIVGPVGQEPYVAAAKLKLDPNEYLSYSVEQLYAFKPSLNDNLDPSQLREIEVDPNGNVYLLNSLDINRNDILWVYDNEGKLRSQCELEDPNIARAPIAMCLSHYDDSTIYLASSQNDPNANSVSIYAFPRASLSKLEPNEIQSIAIEGMGHVSDITEDPATGTLWIVGFQMKNIPEYINLTKPPFYQPRLAKITIPFESNDLISAIDISTSWNLALPLSIIWLGSLDRCAGADLDDSSQVNLLDLQILMNHWLQKGTDPDWLEKADLDNSESIDLGDFAIMGQYWLKSGCSNP